MSETCVIAVFEQPAGLSELLPFALAVAQNDFSSLAALLELDACPDWRRPLVRSAEKQPALAVLVERI